MIYVSDRDPLYSLANAKQPGTLAIITHVEGPSYRSLGAAMAIMADGEQVGTLSSGCIEADLVFHAQKARETGKPVTARYGQGSPFIDIQLPCGGTLDVTLVHAPDQQILAELIRRLDQRQACSLQVDCASGELALNAPAPTGTKGSLFSVLLTPALRFLTFGKGPEALTFATLAQSASFSTHLLTPDEAMCEKAAKIGCEVRHLTKPEFPADVAVDAWTAIVLFFHDHDWEPPILKDALPSPAFYIGAQGSRMASQTLKMELEDLGTDADHLKKLRGSIGLVASARDARTLAVSVLAEILAVAKEEDEKNERL